MLIYLDTKDLINLLEHDRPRPIQEFDAILRAGLHNLAVSFSNVKELSRPLLEPGARTVVTRLLNQLEKLPLRYIREGTIIRDELSEAREAFAGGREYRAISPFVARFDEAFSPFLRPLASAMYLTLSLAESVFTLWQLNPSWLGPPTSHGLPPIKVHLEADRMHRGPSDAASNFAFAVANHLRDLATRKLLPDDLEAWALTSSAEDRKCFAGWIYADPRRCPALRLSDEFYHAVRKNASYTPSDSLVGDFAHIKCLPYVDLITLDRGTHDHVRRIADRIIPGCADKICGNLEEVLRRLARGDCPSS